MTDGREEGSGEVKGRARARPPATRHTRALLSVSSLFPPDSKQRLAPLQGGATVISDNGRVCVSVRRRLPPPPILKRMHEPMEVLDFWIGVQLDNFYFHHKRKKATHSMNDIQF
ncbi:Hypothetical predicted protein [Podarcis lilfordi]|uniref:Uncharacterized protein n=1 Tax=Podarcis lilfordi TaxID=74358 RepID=A0AA35PM63_9SAUR|nr:Hypothetical predicted protein [Podarcis lilfordi]